VDAGSDIKNEIEKKDEKNVEDKNSNQEPPLKKVRRECDVFKFRMDHSEVAGGSLGNELNFFYFSLQSKRTSTT